VEYWHEVDKVEDLVFIDEQARRRNDFGVMRALLKGNRAYDDAPHQRATI